MFRQRYQIKNLNLPLAGAVIALGVLGVVFINDADSSYTGKQLVGLIACLGLMFLFAAIDYNYILSYSNVLYIINLIMLLSVKLFGSSAGGAKRWINLGFTRIQPSEFTKIIMIIFVANYIQEHEEDFRQPKVLVKLLVLCVIPMFLVLSQPDLSTTMDIAMILFAVIFVGGLNGKLIRNAVLILVPLMAVFLWYIQTPNQILLKEYQVTRIMTFVDPADYSDTTAYQQDNSVMAIGSGQLFGKGISHNTISEVNVTDTGLVSEQQTDFIFSVVGEEVGFIGSVIVIALMGLLVVQCLIIGHRSKNMSGRLIAVGMAALIGFQSFINIGVATEILPNTGLTLPFISYGLTSLLSCTIGMGIVLNIGLQRQY
ncbi:MAG: FtsW/RodA/SpoVE family cell cycle protein [Lachnospiraceae bacterium]|nr:FtsW/RodA/SpoVE family cell cycle protein [Lachnospiraceae bacterium]